VWPRAATTCATTAQRLGIASVAQTLLLQSVTTCICAATNCRQCKHQQYMYFDTHHTLSLAPTNAAVKPSLSTPAVAAATAPTDSYYTHIFTASSAAACMAAAPVASSCCQHICSTSSPAAACSSNSTPVKCTSCSCLQTTAASAASAAAACWLLLMPWRVLLGRLAQQQLVRS
jgi:hypothetical protein